MFCVIYVPSSLRSPACNSAVSSDVAFVGFLTLWCIDVHVPLISVENLLRFLKIGCWRANYPSEVGTVRSLQGPSGTSCPAPQPMTAAHAHASYIGAGHGPPLARSRPQPPAARDSADDLGARFPARPWQRLSESGRDHDDDDDVDVGIINMHMKLDSDPGRGRFKFMQVALPVLVYTRKCRCLLRAELQLKWLQWLRSDCRCIDINLPRCQSTCACIPGIRDPIGARTVNSPAQLMTSQVMTAATACALREIQYGRASLQSSRARGAGTPRGACGNRAGAGHMGPRRMYMCTPSQHRLQC